MMNSKDELSDVKKRFDDECKSISNYAYLMGNITKLPKWSKVQYIIGTLKEYDLLVSSYEEEKYKIMLNTNPNKLMNFFNEHYQNLNNKIKYFEDVFNDIKESKIFLKKELEEMEEGILEYIRTGYYDDENRSEKILEIQEFFDNEIISLLEIQEEFDKEYTVTECLPTMIIYKTIL